MCICECNFASVSNIYTAPPVALIFEIYGKCQVVVMAWYVKIQ